MFRLSCLLIGLPAFWCGCSSLKNASKYSFTSGRYQTREGNERTPVYVSATGDSIAMYRLEKNSHALTNQTPLRLFVPVAHKQMPAQVFQTTTFDIDFLTIPFKFRPAQPQFPRQFTTNLNGAVYTGYRTDRYRISYQQTPLGVYMQQQTHFGFSGGVFTGLGATAMNPWVTGNAIDIEYDGFVWSKGFAGIVAIDRFTVGLALGWDYLLDKNRKVWFYQNKPWAGLAFGLNLN